MKRQLVFLAAVLTALSLRAEQKNVKLLTNMTDQQLGRTMNMMRASLGVNCDFCHVTDDKGVWQWDRDDKKEKKTAREMISMVLKLNKEDFEGHVDVSCWTCHRGAIRPQGLVSLPQTAPPFPTPKQERPTLPTLDEVVKKYTAALGNMEMLQKPRRMKGVREGYDGRPVPIDVVESGARWHVLASLPTGPVEQVVTETGGWIKDPKGVTALPDNALESFRELAPLMTPPLPSTIPADARVVGKETVGNADTVVVAYRTKDQLRHRLYFNTTTGLLARAVTLTETPIGLIPQQTDFEQWQQLSGTAFPFKVRTSLVDPWSSSSRTYTMVTLDAKMNGAEFDKPK